MDGDIQVAPEGVQNNHTFFGIFLPLSRVQSKRAVFFPDCTVISHGAKVVSLLNQCDVIWGFPYIDTAGIQKFIGGHSFSRPGPHRGAIHSHDPHRGLFSRPASGAILTGRIGGYSHGPHRGPFMHDPHRGPFILTTRIGGHSCTTGPFMHDPHRGPFSRPASGAILTGRIGGYSHSPHRGGYSHSLHQGLFS
jgi:hypothetical protein